MAVISAKLLLFCAIENSFTGIFAARVVRTGHQIDHLEQSRAPEGVNCPLCNRGWNLLPEMFNDGVLSFCRSAPSAPRGSPSGAAKNSPNKLAQIRKSAPQGMDLFVSIADVTKGSAAVCHGQIFLRFVLWMLLLVSGVPFIYTS